MKTFLFDFDGTLVDSMPTFVSVMMRILLNGLCTIAQKMKWKKRKVPSSCTMLFSIMKGAAANERIQDGKSRLN